MKKIYFNLYTLSVVVIMLSMSSCKKYLDVPPSKSTGIQITTTANLDALLENYATMGQETNGGTRMFATDDFDFSVATVTAAPSFFGQLPAIYQATWDRTYMQNSGNGDWTFQWSKIFTANLILTSLAKVTGSDQDKERLRAEAYFIRAYSYYILVNTYCLPYTSGTGQELGLPLKVSTSFEADLTRATLEQTYAQIESDLAEALKTTQTISQNGVFKPWRANITGVNAFAARYYLNRGNYSDAEKFATKSLDSYSTLVNYNTEMGFSPTFSNFPVTYGTVDITWKEFTYYRQAMHGGLIVPSADLTALYDQSNDLRYTYHFVKGGAALLGAPSIPINYAFFAFFYIPSGTTVSEMILTKAEAIARQGSGRFAEAMATVNLLRAKRIKPGSAVNLLANTDAAAVTAILAERRRELPFSMRWFDLRRLNHNDDPNDNKTVNRTFYQYNASGTLTTSPQVTYSLVPGSRKYAVVIPTTEIVSSQGVIVQNTY